MSSSALIASVIALASAGYTAGASPTTIFYTIDSPAWATYATNLGASISTETFNSQANGYYTSGINGSTAGILWTANALNGGVRVSAGSVYTSTPSNLLSFTFAPGVNGIAGNLYGTNGASNGNNPVPTTITVTLADGTMYIGNTNGPEGFIGFYSTGATISSLSVSAANYPSSPSAIYATADNLYFATVPAPGAVALIGLAGVVARRREHRA